MKMLIDEDRLQARISEMALEIDEYYQGQDWYQRTQEPVVVIGVLTGAIFFMADLIRKLSIRTEIDFIRTSTWSYSVSPKIISLPKKELRDTHILLIDDILDTGRTLKTIKTQLSWKYPEDIRMAVLLRKLEKAPVDVMVDFVGFDIPDEFVVGYGLDYDGRYREKPYVAVWSENES